MAKDTFDIVTDVIGLINTPEVLALLSGGRIDPSVKTTGPEVRGIVVNALGITNSSEQKGAGNVNCYVPAIISTINGKSVSLPNQQVLSTLAKVIKPLIDGQRMPHFESWVDEMPILLKDTDGSYFVNIAFSYQASQNNFKNI